MKQLQRDEGKYKHPKTGCQAPNGTLAIGLGNTCSKRLAPNGSTPMSCSTKTQRRHYRADFLREHRPLHDMAYTRLRSMVQTEALTKDIPSAIWRIRIWTTRWMGGRPTPARARYGARVWRRTPPPVWGGPWGGWSVRTIYCNLRDLGEITDCGRAGNRGSANNPSSTAMPLTQH